VNWGGVFFGTTLDVANKTTLQSYE
jgi:hypothetical protein